MTKQPHITKPNIYQWKKSTNENPNPPILQHQNHEVYLNHPKSTKSKSMNFSNTLSIPGFSTNVRILKIGIERATVAQTNHNYQLPTHAPIVHIVPMDCSMVKTYGQTNTNRYHADQVSLVSVHAIYKPRPRHIKSSGPWYTNWTNIKPTIDQRSDPYTLPNKTKDCPISFQPKSKINNKTKGLSTQTTPMSIPMIISR